MHEQERPNTLNIPSQGALSLHIRPRSSSYGALSSPNADIDDDILETDDNLSPLTPPSDSPESYLNSKGSPEDGAPAHSSLFRIGQQGPWQYSDDLNFEDNFAIAHQYAMPVGAGHAQSEGTSDASSAQPSQQNTQMDRDRSNGSSCDTTISDVPKLNVQEYKTEPVE